MTTTPQAALLSDDEWLEYLLKHADAATLYVAAEKGQSIQTMGRWVLRMDANNLRKLAETAILAKLQATQEPVQAMCEACGSHATHEVGPERTSFPGAYCDDCDPPTAQAEPVQAGELHDAIMNLQCVPKNMESEPNQRLAYKIGHRDARHAAAELAAEHEARAAISACKPLTQQWEFFSDPAYFDMWAVRPIGSKDFDAPFHVTSPVEAQNLCAKLNGIGLEVKP